jgi:hypothetical protein
MKLLHSRHVQGFSLGEMLIAAGIAAVLFAGIFAGSVSLNRAYAASNDYFSTHLQQIRIIDYLARDVKRSFSVTTSPDLKTVTCVMPNYIVQAGDPEAVTDATTIGMRRTPLVVGTINKAIVDYGARGTRTVTDGVTTNASATLTSATAAFSSQDVGNPITGTNIQAATTISGVTNATTVTLSKTATASGSGVTFKVYGDGNRTLTDMVTNNGSPTLTSATAYFTAADVGKPVVGTTIPAGTSISSVTNATTATLSANAINPTDTTTLTAINPFTSSVTIGGTVVVYTVSGSTITRTENGVITTIASSTDQLLPQTTDWQQSNTEYTTTSVTFAPILTTNGNAADKNNRRAGTTVYSTAYLRNKRRGN